jgi:hypothetical protein
MADEKDDGYIRFRCRTCGKHLKVKNTVEGGNVLPCPRCGNAVTVPMGNLEAIAAGTAMAETGDPGRLNLDPELLKKRLRGDDEKREGPGSVGGGPSLREGSWDPTGGFSRITELDQLAASLAKIDEEIVGHIQQLFRQKAQTPENRDAEIKAAGERRREEIRKLLENRIQDTRLQMRRLAAMENRLGRGERDQLDRLRRTVEAMELLARHVHGVEI